MVCALGFALPLSISLRVVMCLRKKALTSSELSTPFESASISSAPLQCETSSSDRERSLDVTSPARASKCATAGCGGERERDKGAQEGAPPSCSGVPSSYRSMTVTEQTAGRHLRRRVEA